MVFFFEIERKNQHGDQKESALLNYGQYLNNFICNKISARYQINLISCLIELIIALFVVFSNDLMIEIKNLQSVINKCTVNKSLNKRLDYYKT